MIIIGILISVVLTLHSAILTIRSSAPLPSLPNENSPTDSITSLEIKVAEAASPKCLSSLCPKDEYV
jgi:hypothetical protein